MIDRLSRALLRPWRSPAFRIQALALLVAALGIAAVVLVRGELDHRFARHTAEALGGDLVLQGSQPASDAQKRLIAGHPHSAADRFTTVLVHGDTFVLTSVDAVDDHYPLYGDVTVADHRFGTLHKLSHGPAPGRVWVEGSALDRLDLKVGEFVTVGDTPFLIGKLLVREPDQGAGFFSMNPRLLMNLADVPATGILGPGTRVHYELRVAAAGSTLTPLVQALTPTLADDQKLTSREQSGLRSLGPLRQLTLWGQLAVMMVVLLCGGAVYLAAGVRAREQAARCAVMKTFGATRARLLRRLLGPELVALSPPLLLGLALALAAFMAVRAWLGNDDGWVPAWPVWLLLVVAPPLIWAGFALPRLWRLASLSARDLLAEHPVPPTARTGITLIGALLTPVGVALMLSGSLAALGQLLVLMVAVAVGMPLLLWAPLRLADRAGGRLPLAARLAVRRLARRPLTTLPMLAALVLALAVMSLATQVGHDLLAQWRAELPDKAPNYFVLNLFDRDLPGFRHWLREHGVAPPHLYPVVRARLTAINGQPAAKAAADKGGDSGDHALHRDLSLTESATLPASNRVSAGKWLADTPGQVSVADKLARDLGINVGDRLTFTAQSGRVSATVTSLRQVNWESFQPNFYFMFSPGTLKSLNRYWLTSFYLPPDRVSQLPDLIRAFPQITLLDVNALLDQAQNLIARAARAATVLGALLLGAGLLVMAAAWLAGREQRQRDDALLRVLGARNGLLKRVAMMETGLLLGAGALFAHLVHLAALWPLGDTLFHGRIPLSGWILLPWAVVLPVLLVQGLIPRRASRPLARLAG